MSKGAETRYQILHHASRLASQVGVEGLTIGALADDLQLSKSGLFRHFRSKEGLQVAVLDHAAESFTAEVVRPALQEPRGEPRMRAIFERWLAWGLDVKKPGGCVFVAAATELDDRPGAAHDRLVALQRQWIDVVQATFLKGIEAGAFSPAADPAQFAQDLYGIMLAGHHHARLLRDPSAESRARHAFEALLAAVRA